MYNRRKKKNKKFILSVISLIIIILLIASFTIKDEREITFIEKALKDTSNLITNIIDKPVNFFKEKIKENKEKKEMYDKYKALEEKVDQINKIETENEELKKEVKELKEQLDLNYTLSEYSYLNANVSMRNIGYWYNTITIDKGENSSVSEDMAVINNKGLIGKTIKVSGFSSTVKLLTDEEFEHKLSVKVKTKDNYAFGLLAGYDKEKGTFKIEGIPHNVEIKNGALVTTTGMGNTFPSGILIGKVVNSTTDNFDLARILEIKSEVDFNNISTVTVLRRKVK